MFGPTAIMKTSCESVCFLRYNNNNKNMSKPMVVSNHFFVDQLYVKKKIRLIRLYPVFTVQFMPLSLTITICNPGFDF